MNRRQWFGLAIVLCVAVCGPTAWAQERTQNPAQRECLQKDEHPCPGMRYQIAYSTTTGEIKATGGYDPSISPGAFSASSGEELVEFTNVPRSVVRELLTAKFTDYYVDIKTKQIRRKSDDGLVGATIVRPSLLKPISLSVLGAILICATLIGLKRSRSAPISKRA